MNALTKTRVPDDVMALGLENLMRLRTGKGSFRAEYAGTLFLIPYYVGTYAILGEPMPPAMREGFIRYLTSQQHDDGGWGLDIESKSYVVSSVTNYVAMRLMGVAADDERLVRARRWFLPHGGGLAASSWGKFLLTILGLYEYDGLNPLLPELWLLPEWMPLHPSRYWVHCRMVYLPMSYLCGKRFVTPQSPLLRAIRDELYEQPYEQIDWKKARHRVAPTDSYAPYTRTLRLGFDAMQVYERGHSEKLRAKAMATVLDHIRVEDESSDFVCVGPLNKVLDAIVWHVEDPGCERVKKHVARMPEYVWFGDDGAKVKSYNSSEVWDTAFAVQAIVLSGQTAQYREALTGAQRFLEAEQILDDVPDAKRHYRDVRRGGWGFGTRDQGWPVSDCTGEALKAMVLLEPLKLPAKTVSRERMLEGIDLILAMQNPDGGFCTYERTRGPKWLELFNPSDFFAEIMVEYSYLECTSSSVQALALLRDRFPERHEAIDASIARAVAYWRREQRADGSWEGFWGVCFTYGTWFVLDGLRAAGVPFDDPAVVRAAEFLESKQRPDGGWSETIESSRQRRYVEAETSQTVQTSWAILGLLAAGRASSEAVRRGCANLRAKQRDDGSWEKEHVAGVTNRNCAIDYVSYWSIFPVWALAASTRGEG